MTVQHNERNYKTWFHAATNLVTKWQKSDQKWLKWWKVIKMSKFNKTVKVTKVIKVIKVIKWNYDKWLKWWNAQN